MQELGHVIIQQQHTTGTQLFFTVIFSTETISLIAAMPLKPYKMYIFLSLWFLSYCHLVFFIDGDKEEDRKQSAKKGGKRQLSGAEKHQFLTQFENDILSTKMN